MSGMFVKLSLGALCLLAACDELPGAKLPDRLSMAKPAPSFAALWSVQCAGCHGANGTSGAARPLNDPAYLAAAPDSFLRSVIAEGQMPMMPAFALHRGGPLDDAAVNMIVAGMRREWARSDASSLVAPPVSAVLYQSRALGAGSESTTPAGVSSSDAATATVGDVARGEAIFASACGACHSGKSSVTDPVYLRLVSDQALWSATVFGRKDLGMPDWQGPFAARKEPLSPQEVFDVVAYMASHRGANTGISK